MFDSKNVIVLDQMLILTKEGKNDLVYHNDTLLKVMMISNRGRSKFCVSKFD